MKFVTFNIRCDFGQDGANNFIYRRPLILEKIRQEKPDIIGFQEVLPQVAAWLKENLTEYYIAGCGREKDLTGEAMIIAYRKERFQSVSLETFWLSPTPYVPGSRYPVQSMCPRTATDVVFEDMETGKVFRVINTHLDHECAGARKLGLEQILAHLRAEKAFADVPVILSGDFNAEPDSEEMKPLRETAGLVNATQQNQYLDGRMVLNCGDATATEIDHEVMKILKESYEQAKELLAANRDAMDEIAAYLIQKETITGKEFMEIFHQVIAKRNGNAEEAVENPENTETENTALPEADFTVNPEV